MTPRRISRTAFGLLALSLAAFAEDAGDPGRDPVYGLGILTSGPKISLALTAKGN